MSNGGGFLPPTDATPRARTPARRPKTLPDAQLQPLSERQQSALILHFDAEMDKLIGGMKSRLVSSPFKDLGYALQAGTRLLNLILAIPPFLTAASLRTAYLLRLTGDFTSALQQYDLSNADAKASTFAFFDLLDRGWLACLRGQIWDRALAKGLSPIEVSEAEGRQVETVGAVTMTERARLLSLALRCKESLAEQTQAVSVLDAEVDDASGPGSDDDEMQTDNGITNAGSVVGATSLALGGIFARTLSYLDSPSGGGLTDV